jgi:hypothetical protein
VSTNGKVELVTELWTAFGIGGAASGEPLNFQHHTGLEVPRNEITANGLKEARIVYYGDDSNPTIEVTAMTQSFAADAWYNLERVLKRNVAKVVAEL